jgi:hypothetical protein
MKRGCGGRLRHRVLLLVVLGVVQGHCQEQDQQAHVVDVQEEREEQEEHHEQEEREEELAQEQLLLLLALVQSDKHVVPEAIVVRFPESFESVLLHL